MGPANILNKFEIKVSETLRSILIFIEFFCFTEIWLAQLKIEHPFQGSEGTK